jgi:hypothetical protein
MSQCSRAQFGGFHAKLNTVCLIETLPCQLIRSSSVYGDRTWRTRASSMTVSITSVNTMTKVKYTDKFSDQPCIYSSSGPVHLAVSRCSEVEVPGQRVEGQVPALLASGHLPPE